MAITMWISFFCITFITTVALKFYLYYRNKKKNAVEKLCKIVRKNDVISCVRYLQENSQSVNAFSESGYTPFLVACAKGNTQIVKFMLSKGADICLKSVYNESPFYLATFYYIKYPEFPNATCIRELYYAGANIDEPNDKGLTPLQMAAMFGHTALVKWLLTKNASIRVSPDPYLIAITQGHHHTAEIIWKMTTVLSIDLRN